MSHVTQNELFDLRRGDLPGDRAASIRDHLASCEACYALMTSLNWLEERLDEAPLPVATPEFIEHTVAAVRAAADREGAVKVDGTARVRRNGSRLWIRRLAWAAGVVLATLFFQANIWSPLPNATIVQAVFSLPPEAQAETLQAVADDTTLVVTVYPGPRFSVPELDGRYTMEELVAALKGLPDGGKRRRVVLVGSDPNAPVQVTQGDLEPLARLTGAPSAVFGEGIAFTLGSEEPSRRINIPIRIFKSLNKRTAPKVLTLTAGRLVVETDSLRTGIRVTTTPEPEETLISELRSGREASITLLPDGTFAMNRQYVDETELEAALRALHEHRPDITLRILVAKSGGDAPSAIIRAANRVGIKMIEVKRP